MRDYVYTGLMRSVGFYVFSGGVMLLLACEFGRGWSSWPDTLAVLGRARDGAHVSISGLPEPLLDVQSRSTFGAVPCGSLRKPLSNMRERSTLTCPVAQHPLHPSSHA